MVSQTAASFTAFVQPVYEFVLDVNIFSQTEKLFCKGFLRFPRQPILLDYNN